MDVEASADWIRRRLVEIDDEVRSLPSDDFARKHALRSEGDRLRELLGQGVEADASQTLAQWADRAVRKASHSADEELEEAKARLTSSGESGM